MMSSDSGRRADDIPPELPVKQHRSSSSRGSSVEFDSGMLSPVGLLYQIDIYNDVFPETTDCHAAQCPIHQSYNPPRQQVRFLSGDTPPPIPKKRLVRTLSLPGFSAPPPLSPLSPICPLVKEQPQNLDNPLYMLAPMPNKNSHGDKEELKPIRGVPVSFCELTFETPDQYLPYLFSSLDDQRIFQGLQHRHLLFLRSMAQSAFAGILLQGEAAERDLSSHPAQDFLLCEGSEPKQIGDAVYYSLRSPVFPGRVLGLRVLKQMEEFSSADTKEKLRHVNVQRVIAHFQLSNASMNDSVTYQNQDPSGALKLSRTTVKPPVEGSAVHPVDLQSCDVTPLQHLLMTGRSLCVERDLPHATLEDLVQNSSSMPSTHCVNYDRQVCVLLLQIILGLQHLYNTSASVAALTPRRIALVWPNIEEKEASRSKVEMIQTLWKTHGCPRVVLTPLSPSLSVPHTLIYIKSQIRALIHYCLDSQDSLTPLGSDPTLSKSSYRGGLLYLASLLQRDSSGPQMADMAAMLQVLLWGPHLPHLEHRRLMSIPVHNWLTVKRALLVMKQAETALVQEQSDLDWEACLCLHYLSFTDPEVIVSINSHLRLTLNID